jgi:hypothetical protein
MELQVHHQQSFKSSTSLDLANKMNSLCIPTRYKIFPPSDKLVYGLGFKVQNRELVLYTIQFR